MRSRARAATRAGSGRRNGRARRGTLEGRTIVYVGVRIRDLSWLRARRPPLPDCRYVCELLRCPLGPGGRRRDLRDLPARRAAVEVRRRTAALLAQGAAREPAAQRGRRRG